MNVHKKERKKNTHTHTHIQKENTQSVALRDCIPFEPVSEVTTRGRVRVS